MKDQVSTWELRARKHILHPCLNLPLKRAAGAFLNLPGELLVKSKVSTSELTVLLEFPFRCKPLSKRGEEVPLPGSLDGPGDPANQTETHCRWSHQRSRSVLPEGPPTGVAWGVPRQAPGGSSCWYGLCSQRWPLAAHPPCGRPHLHPTKRLAEGGQDQLLARAAPGPGAERRGLSKPVPWPRGLHEPALPTTRITMLTSHTYS